MIDNLQLGQHPDADQLTAFAEQTLPQHEQQQTLAHLAACADCRRIVFLAQQAEPEELPQPAPLRKLWRPWFSGWNLAWPTAAALAAIVGYSVYLHNVRSTKDTARPATTASVEVIAATPSLETQEAQVAVVQPKADRKIAPGADKPHATLGASSIHGSLSDRATNQPQVQDQQFIALARGGAKPTAVTVDGAPGIASRAGVEQAEALPQQTTASVSLAQARPERVFQAAPPPAAAPKIASQTVVVSGATDALATTMNNATSMDMLVDDPGRAALPSHLPVRSLISNGSRTLALDNNGELFLSTDGGKNWKPVAVQWNGRAVQVGIVSMPSSRVASFAKAMPSGIAVERKSSGDSGHSGDISGSVSDPAGAAIPGASVNLRAVSGSEVRVTHTDAAGQFALAGLRPGTWQVEVSAPGFATYSASTEIRAGDGVSVSATLQAGSVAETVTVTGAGVVAARPATAPAFVLTNDAGVNWTSNDGQSWKRK